ncbi:glycine zipper domain-containing protein [Acinetobacter schindleri]|jgi:surface antigen|uniref:glycine zipper domain-containing protein n=1 Tax=Acinetobacter schindleri TaxID=108981 RepID=UPI000972706D|nr:hypothetical protein [Acinetobacter schindleri]APX62545.1 hypothetical protein AsACE_CH01138 [Acinetobacter schindleri]
MTNTNRPVSDINPASHRDLSQERTDVLRDDEALKSSPTTSGSARPDLNLPDTESHRVPDMNEAGDHPVATSAGTLGGAAAGAAIGAVGGPAGAVVGGLVGGVVGGLAGNEMAESARPTLDTPEGIALSGSENLQDDDHYWREQHHQTPYYSESRNVYGDLDYDRDYRSAYRLGYENREYYNGKEFNEAEPDLRTKWEQVKGDSRLNWEEAKFAVKDAWHRATR